MSDLISREEAIKMLREKAQGYVVSMFATMTECNITKIVAMECANELNGLPTVDAEPVRHGKWVPCAGKPCIWYCSECGERISYNQACRTYKPTSKPVHEVNRWCRSCGARMDLEDDQP